MRPTSEEHSPYFAGYIGLVQELDIVPVLQQQLSSEVASWKSIPESESAVIHSPYSWTIYQVLQHLADGERVFGYRLLRVARGDKTPLPGFDENLFAMSSLENPTSLKECIEEFEALRRANLVLCQGLSQEAWKRIGFAGDHPISVRALAYIMAGHVRHHQKALVKRCPFLASEKAIS